MSAKDIGRGQIASDLNNDPAREAASFISQIIILDHLGPISAGYTALLSTHTTSVPCQIVEIFETRDRQTGKTMEIAPKFVKTGDGCVVKLVPTSPLCIEESYDYPRLGRFVLRNSNTTIAAGVVKSVEKK